MEFGTRFVVGGGGTDVREAIRQEVGKRVAEVGSGRVSPGSTGSDVPANSGGGTTSSSAGLADRLSKVEDRLGKVEDQLKEINAKVTAMYEEKKQREDYNLLRAAVRKEITEQNKQLAPILRLLSEPEAQRKEKAADIDALIKKLEGQ
jgi:hypothetical protein